MNEFTSTTAQDKPANNETSQDPTSTQAQAPTTETAHAASACTQPETDDESLRHIPLSKLIASPLNVRKSGGQDIDELAMLILSQGLLQGLVVIPHITKKGKATDRFEVVAGGRRRRALARLAELGRIANDEKVLCKLTTREKALAASVAENSGREPMSKPDTVQAFAAMAASGATPEDISVSFGITPLTVMRRLKLANVCDERHGRCRAPSWRPRPRALPTFFARCLIFLAKRRAGTIIQGWLDGQELPESARRILSTADKIMKAGQRTE